MAEKTRNGGKWTEARFRSFIISALRTATRKWGPRNECLKQARVRRGVYKCAMCEQEVPATKVITLKNGKEKKVKNIFADHIEPIVDPEVGFVDWNTWIERAFVELDGFQALCHDCHKKKSDEERVKRKR
jgi:hypothetical protein